MLASGFWSRASIASTRIRLWIAIDPMHHRRIAHAAHDIGKVLAVAHLDGEHQRRGLLVALLVLDVFDVGIALGDGRSHGGENAGLVVYDDAQARAIIAGYFAVPVDGDDALGRLAVFGHVRAIRAMHDDALARRQVTG